MTDVIFTETCLYAPKNGSKQANTDRKDRKNDDRRIKRFKVSNHSGSNFKDIVTIFKF